MESSPPHVLEAGATSSDIKYICTSCHSSTARSLLMVKKVTFSTMGEGPRVIKSRRVGWLCPSCVRDDEAWNLPDLKGRSPEMAVNG